MFIVRDRRNGHLHELESAHKVGIFMLGRVAMHYEAFYLKPCAWPENLEFNEIERAMKKGSETSE